MTTVIEIAGKSYPLFNKAELRKRELQDALKYAYENKDKTNCICRCTDNSAHPLLYAVKKRNDYFYIAKFATHKSGHAKSCIYHAENKYEDDLGCFSSNIFKEPNASDKRPPKSNERTEQKKQNTFIKLCLSLISQTSLFAFHATNKGVNLREELCIPTRDDFFRFLWMKINKDTNFMSSGQTIAQSIPSGHKILCGIINQPLFDNETQDGEELLIKLPVKQKKGFIDFNLKIKGKRYKLSRKHIINWGVLISPPYFFIAVTDPHNQVIRLFIYPLYAENGKLIFVESHPERLFCQRLIKQNLAFIKPIVGNEFGHLKRSLLTYNGSPASLNMVYRPDFIVFRKQDISIVEVTGYLDKDYQASLARKREWFRQEIEQNNWKNFYKYYEVPHNTIEPSND